MRTHSVLNLTRSLALAAVLTVGLSACDSGSNIDGLSSTSDSDAIALLASDLGLTAGDLANISASASSIAGTDASGNFTGDPGDLWRLAAELHATLSADQLARILDRLEQMGPGAQGQRPNNGQRPGMGGPNGGQRPDSPDRGDAFASLNLSAEQQSAIDAIHEAARGEMEALRAQDLDRDAMRAAAEALREQVRADVEAVLTAEQIAQLEAQRAEHEAEMEARRAEHEANMEANRAAAEEARNEVLGLTAEQIAGLEALHTAAQDFRATQQAARDAGATREELQAAGEAFHAEQQAAIEALLTDTQLEISAIHRFLAQRAQQGRPGGQGGPGGPGGPGGQGGPGGRPGSQG